MTSLKLLSSEVGNSCVCTGSFFPTKHAHSQNTTESLEESNLKLQTADSEFQQADSKNS